MFMEPALEAAIKKYANAAMKHAENTPAHLLINKAVFLIFDSYEVCDARNRILAKAAELLVTAKQDLTGSPWHSPVQEALTHIASAIQTSDDEFLLKANSLLRTASDEMEDEVIIKRCKINRDRFSAAKAANDLIDEDGVFFKKLYVVSRDDLKLENVGKFILPKEEYTYVVDDGVASIHQDRFERFLDLTDQVKKDGVALKDAFLFPEDGDNLVQVGKHLLPKGTYTFATPDVYNDTLYGWSVMLENEEIMLARWAFGLWKNARG